MMFWVMDQDRPVNARMAIISLSLISLLAIRHGFNVAATDTF